MFGDINLKYSDGKLDLLTKRNEKYVCENNSGSVPRKQ